MSKFGFHIDKINNLQNMTAKQQSDDFQHTLYSYVEKSIIMNFTKQLLISTLASNQ